jgi:hypothetical protein
MSDLSVADVEKVLSPSSVGSGAICTLQILFNARYKERDDKFMPQKAFGHVCHYHAQERMGCAPPERYSDEDERLARKCPKLKDMTDDAYTAHVTSVCNKAATAIQMLSPLPSGMSWKSEWRAYTDRFCPTRVSRKGDKGYGGYVDLYRTDGKVGWDFKFSSKIPGLDEPKMDYAIEVEFFEYLIQCWSYHEAAGLEETGILWTHRLSKEQSVFRIDWTSSFGKELAKYYGNMLRFFNSKHFPKAAWPNPGSACLFCKHTHRCPLKNVAAPRVITLDVDRHLAEQHRSKLMDQRAAERLNDTTPNPEGGQMNLPKLPKPPGAAGAAAAGGSPPGAAAAGGPPPSTLPATPPAGGLPTLPKPPSATGAPAGAPPANTPPAGLPPGAPAGAPPANTPPAGPPPGAPAGAPAGAPPASTPPTTAPETKPGNLKSRAENLIEGDTSWLM